MTRSEPEATSGPLEAGVDAAAYPGTSPVRRTPPVPRFLRVLGPGGSHGVTCTDLAQKEELPWAR